MTGSLLSTARLSGLANGLPLGGASVASSRTEALDAQCVADDGDAAGEKMRVLVIDDNYDAASALSMLVDLWGYDVQVGYNGHEALDRTARFAPHAVLLDVGLPGLSGYEAARRIRAAERERGVEPALLVAVTGYGSPDDIALAFRAGFDHHLLKPSDAQLLEAVLDAHASRRRARLGKVMHEAAGIP